jgi:hypothetical protein
MNGFAKKARKNSPKLVGVWGRRPRRGPGAEPLAFFPPKRQGYLTVTLVACDATPLAMTTRLLGPVSIPVGTVKCV